jgi:hypothetical protein
MTKKLKLFTFFSLITPLSAICMERNWLQQKFSDFTKKMLNTTTYSYGTKDHLTSLACVFFMPNQLGKFILAQQRSNMKRFLKKNEADALEEIRKHYTIDPEIWQEQVIEKSQADLEFNLAAMGETGNNYNTSHDPNLPKEWVDGITKECNRHKFNIHNLNLIASHDPNDSFIATASDFLPNANNKYVPANITLSINAYNEHIAHGSALQLIQLAGPHEMTHLTQGHAILTENFLNLIAPIPTIPTYNQEIQPIPTYNEEIQLIDIYSPEEIQQKLEQLKKIKEDCDIRTQLIKSPLYSDLSTAKEKTADTLLSCDDAEIAKNYLSLKKMLNSQGLSMPYPANDNDIAVLDANWKTTLAIENSRKMLFLARYAPQRLIMHAYKKASDLFTKQEA